MEVAFLGVYIGLVRNNPDWMRLDIRSIECQEVEWTSFCFTSAGFECSCGVCDIPLSPRFVSSWVSKDLEVFTSSF